MQVQFFLKNNNLGTHKQSFTGLPFQGGFLPLYAIPATPFDSASFKK
jgi:hypothetical protein